MNRFCLLVTIFLLLILPGMDPPRHPIAQAGSFIQVNTTVDELNADGDCALREAIQAANTDSAVDACPAGSGSDTIPLPAGIYVLSIAGRGENQSATGDLDILGSLMISGAGQGLTRIDGGGVDRVFEIIGTPVVSISGVTIQGGNPGTSTGGPQVYGGGISIFGNATLNLSQTILLSNTAYQGGGLENNGGTANLDEVSIRQNTATYMGGIHSTGPLAINHSTIEANASTLYGAGVHSEFSLLLENSLLTGNIAGTYGGGLYIHGGTAVIRNTTISANQIHGVQGGGIWIYYQAEVSIINSTISNNSGGGGVFDYHEGPGGELPPVNIHILNTLFEANTPWNCGRSINAPHYDSQGHNLDSGNSCGFGAIGDLANTPAGIGPLQDNGGPTLTHALLAGSAAINAADNNGCPATDQRGVLRPQAGSCDIGAYERLPSSEANLSLSKTDAVDPVSVGNNIVYDLTVNNLGPDSSSGVTLTDNLPAGVGFVSATPSQGACSHAIDAVTCTLGSIANAGSATVQIVVAANTPGVKVNQAGVASGISDPNLANNSAQANTQVEVRLYLSLICK